MKPNSLRSFFSRSSELRQAEINDIIHKITSSFNPKFSAHKLINGLSIYLKSKYDLANVPLLELYHFKEKSLKCSEASGAGGLNEFNRVAFFTSLGTIIDNEIKNREIAQCENACRDYLAYLKKELRIAFEDEDITGCVSQAQQLTRDKYRIIKQALKQLEKESTYEEKIKAFQDVLTNPENSKILEKQRNHWGTEALKQAGSLFLINLYRMLVGTRGSNLIHLSNTKMYQNTVKDRLRLMQFELEKHELNASVDNDSIHDNRHKSC